MKCKVRVILLILLVFLSCGLDVQPQITEILQNGDIEDGDTTPAFWSFALVGLNEYQFDWSTENYKSYNHSLRIEIESINDGGAFAYWWQLIDSAIPRNKSLLLTVYIKLENVSFPGINIAIRTDASNSGLGFANLKTEIKGNQDWAPYSVVLPYVDLSTERIYVFLICYPKTTGVIYFDDISLTSYDL